MADGRWRISVTAPDWGQDHLSSEAIAAFVDGELAPGPLARARQHLRQCPDCDSQVNGQGQASAALRMAGCPNLSSTFLSTLRSIPQDADLPAPPAGLAMTPDGDFVAVLRPDALRSDHVSGFRASAAVPEHHAGIRQTSVRQRRLLLGTGVAVTGLALGALAFSAPSATPSTPAPASDRGAPGASVLGGSPGFVDARLQLGSSNGSAPGAATRRNGGSFDR